MALIRINMKQFRDKWQVYSDNVYCYEIIQACKGVFRTFNKERYIHWLNEFNIFYTLTEGV